MTFAEMQRRVWTRAKEVFNNPKLRLKDLLEWSTSEDAVKRNMESGDVMAEVSCGIWVCVLKKHDKRKAAKPKKD